MPEAGTNSVRRHSIVKLGMLLKTCGTGIKVSMNLLRADDEKEIQKCGRRKVTREDLQVLPLKKKKNCPRRE